MIENLEGSQADPQGSADRSPDALPRSPCEPNDEGDDLTFSKRRRLFKLEGVTAKRDMPARDRAWKNLKGSSKNTNFYKHRDADVRLWANLLNAILTAKASMFTLSKKIHTVLIEGDKLLERKSQGNAYNIVVALALDEENNLLEEVFLPSKKGDPKRRARLLRVKNPTIRRHLARMVGGEDKLLEEEERIRAEYEEDLQESGEEQKVTAAREEPSSAPASARDHLNPNAREAGPARLESSRRAYLRDVKNWRKLATHRDARIKKMRGVVLALLTRFKHDAFDDITFEEMAYCFVTEEPGKGADEDRWRGLRNALIDVAREAFKLETGRSSASRTAAETPSPADIPDFNGKLLGTDDAP